MESRPRTIDSARPRPRGTLADAREDDTMGVADWGIGHVVSGVTATGEKFAGEVFTFDEGTGLAVLRAKGDIVNTHDVRILRAEGVSDLKSTPPSDPPKMEKLPVVDEARCQKREEAAVKAATISAGVPSVRPLDRSIRARLVLAALISFDRSNPNPRSILSSPRRARTLPPPDPRPSISSHHLLPPPPSPPAPPRAANIGVDVTAEAQDIFDALARTLPCRWEGRSIVVLDEVKISPPYAECVGVATGDPRAVERVQKVLAMEKSKLVKAKK